MKTVRFSKVVERVGAPTAHLVLTDPSKDRTLQAAVKADRVMTVAQQPVGTRANRGQVGFTPGPNRQFLVFPKSLRPFRGREVVGVNYDLLSLPEVPKSKRPAPARLPRKTRAKSKSPTLPPVEKPERPYPRKVVPFEAPIGEDDDDEMADLKNQVRHAISLLEGGKTVAALNVLKRIVAD